MKTKQDVHALKENWVNDPCWDIENTEGFEEYKEELLEFRKGWEDAQTAHTEDVHKRRLRRIYSMQFNESVRLEPNVLMRRVMGGWTIEYYKEPQTYSVFIPFNNEFQIVGEE